MAFFVQMIANRPLTFQRLMNLLSLTRAYVHVRNYLDLQLEVSDHIDFSNYLVDRTLCLCAIHIRQSLDIMWAQNPCPILDTM